MIEFHTADAADVDTVLPRGAPFQTFWEMVDGQRVAAEISHPWNALDVWGADDLARFCVTSVDIPDPPAPLPAEVPMYRVEIVLKQQGLWAGVNDYIASLPEPQRSVAQTLLDKAPNLVVAGEFALQVKAALGLTDEQYRDLIEAALALAF